MVEISLAPCATRLPVSPGQFVLTAFGGGPHYQGCREFHPFSVSGTGPQGVLTVSVKALGPCTRHIQEIEPGVLARLQGPFGTFLADSARSPQLWVAGGVGITPFMAALRRGSVPQPTTLIYLYRTEQEAAFLDELSELAKADPNFELLTEASGNHLPNVDGLLGRVSRLLEREVWLCGPARMVETLKARLQQHGLRPTAIHFESFDFR